MKLSSIPTIFAAIAIITVADITSAASPTTRSTAATACNNSPDLCNKNYNDITYLGAHDIAFLRDASTGFSTSGNQFYNATVALSAGVRLLQAQVHALDGVLELCHTSCSLLDGGSLQAFLADVRSWMDGNPNEVVTLLLVNSDNNSTESFGAVFAASGIDKYGYTPASNPGPQLTWPTLQSMISANTRLVTFIASIDPSSSYPYLLPEFTYLFETSFSVTSPLNFTCTLSRPSSLTSTSTALTTGYLPLLNHFVYESQAFNIQVPDVDDIAITNSPLGNVTGGVGDVLERCTQEYGGRKPVYVLVDFWNVGGPIGAVDGGNGVTAPVGRSVVSGEVLTSGAGGRTAGRTLRWMAVGVALLVIGGMNVLC